MVKELFKGLNEKAVSPVIAIVLLLMMTVAAAGAAYFWLTQMQSSVQKGSRKQITEIMKDVSTRVIAQSTICEIPINNGLVSYWSFYEGSGDTAHDLAGDNNGALNDPSWTQGKIGNALDFDGSDDYVDFPQSLNNQEQAFTVSMWINWKGGDTGERETIFYIGDVYDNGTRLRFRYDNDWIDWQTWKNDIGELCRSDPFPMIGWHFLTVVFDGNEQLMEIFLDGESLATESTSYSEVWFGTDTFRFPNDLDGFLDEVRIYDRALSQSEIQKIYNLNNTKKVKITVYNAGYQDIGKAEWIANLKREGTTIESDTYDAPKLKSNERIILKFSFKKMRPDKEYTISLEGVQTSTTVSC